MASGPLEDFLIFGVETPPKEETGDLGPLAPIAPWLWINRGSVGIPTPCRELHHLPVCMINSTPHPSSIVLEHICNESLLSYEGQSE